MHERVARLSFQCLSQQLFGRRPILSTDGLIGRAELIVDVYACLLLFQRVPYRAVDAIVLERLCEHLANELSRLERAFSRRVLVWEGAHLVDVEGNGCVGLPEYGGTRLAGAISLSELEKDVRAERGDVGNGESRVLDVAIHLA